MVQGCSRQAKRRTCLPCAGNSVDHARSVPTLRTSRPRMRTTTHQENPMSTTALAASNRQIVALRRPPPLLTVLAWEFRRYSSSRLFWVQALGFWGFQLLIIWALRDQGGLIIGHPPF